MEGPTPISAFIHAATMVAAGIFLVARLLPLFIVIPYIMNIIALIGIITLLLGATLALAQKDIKRSLAYSTMSQLGLYDVSSWYWVLSSCFISFDYSCLREMNLQLEDSCRVFTRLMLTS
jgi:NADH:ubiquinone oxidoreductase subunit 4 (subunit M)